MFKWIATIVLVLILCLGALCLLSGQADRNAYMKQHMDMLKIAADDFARYGVVTNVSSNTDRFWLSTNIVAVGGTQYHCYAEVGGGQFGEEGTLAITTNQVFIWLGNNSTPKRIEAGYRSPLLHF
jgi:hypothetical protein